MIIIRTVSLTEAISKYFPFKICAHALPPLYGHCMKRTAELFVFVVQYIVPSQLALKTHTNFGCAATFATLDKLIHRFSLPPVVPPIGDSSVTHVIRLAVHSTTSPVPAAIGQSFITTCICVSADKSIWLCSLPKLIFSQHFSYLFNKKMKR
jgi:hypothetical protein